LKVLGFIAVVITGIMLVVAANDFPDWGDPNSPASTNVSPDFIRHSFDETKTPNFVTVVLADFRGFDTMFETAVIFTAGVAVFFVLRVFQKSGTKPYVGEMAPDVFHRSIITQTVVRLLIPFIQLFALYVVMHGHHSPGGGFQGGVMLGASFILLAIGYDLKTSLKRISERRNIILGNLGVVIYAGIGVLCLLMGGNFLDYGVLSKVLPATGPELARSHGILGIEIGVAIAVMASMMAIYANIASGGKLDKGL